MFSKLFYFWNKLRFVFKIDIFSSGIIIWGRQAGRKKQQKDRYSLFPHFTKAYNIYKHIIIVTYLQILHLFI
jgi:hypothetical protein